MSRNPVVTPTELEPRIVEYLRRLDQIDHLLDGPVRTLVRLAHQRRLKEVGPPHFPLWISARDQTPSQDSTLTSGLCVATLQRLTFVKRSFPWLGAVLKEERERADRIREKLTRNNGQAPAPAEGSAGAAPESGNRQTPAAGEGTAGAAPASGNSQPLAAAEESAGAAPDSDNQRESDSLFEDAYLPKLDKQSHEAFFVECCDRLESKTFGFLNPLTAAQVFRVLMQRGEESAHAGMGCLAFFAMVWPLCRSPQTPFDMGVRIEPSDASAYSTAKCVLPLLELQELCTRRAEVFSELAGNVRRMKEAAEGVGAAQAPASRSTYDEWTFYTELDELRRNLLDLSRLSIAGRAFKEAEKDIGDVQAGRRPCRPPAPGTDGEAANGAAPALPDVPQLFDCVVLCLAEALRMVEITSTWLHEEATTITKQIETWIYVGVLGGAPRPKNGDAGAAASTQTSAAGAGEAAVDPSTLDTVMRVPRPEGGPYAQSFGFTCARNERPGNYGDYLTGLREGAAKALDLCDNILRELERARTLKVDAGDPASIVAALNDLSDMTRKVARQLEKPIGRQAEWCKAVVNREVANASADNFTEFDPSELVSALLVAVRANRLTELQVADAINKALLGVQEDGGWRISHPYFSPDGDRGLVSPAADLVWTLVAVLERFPAIDVADRHLFWFMDWLARTQVRLTLEPPEPPARAAGEASDALACTPEERAAAAEFEPEPRAGWSADRARRSHPRIHLLTTAFAINALLALRELIEHRLWEICEQRFTIIPTSRALKETDPVDLSLPHPQRLHSRMAELMRSALGGGGRRMYSMILHGPPGSSKTTVASALAHDHWRQTRRWGRPGSRLVRVTPADFTGSGEDRIDSEAKLIFQLLGHLRGVTILFDEVDDLLRRRTAERPIFLDLVIPAMLNRLQDLRDACERQDICFLFGTNYVERIEPALMRPGRIDEKFPVVYADFRSRVYMAEKELRDLYERRPPLKAEQALPWKEFAIRCAQVVAQETGGWTWNALREGCEAVHDRIWSQVRRRRPEDKISPPVDIPEPKSWIPDLLKPLWRVADLDGEYRGRIATSPELSMEYVRYLVCRRPDLLDDGTARIEKQLREADAVVPAVVLEALEQFRSTLSV
jgi:hypothetical protein